MRYNQLLLKLQVGVYEEDVRAATLELEVVKNKCQYCHVAILTFKCFVLSNFRVIVCLLFWRWLT